jgi:hypothetical protein
MIAAKTWMLGIATAVAVVGVAAAQGSLDPKTRQELKRAPLTGTNMEVVISVIENKPGDVIPRSHPSWRRSFLPHLGRDAGDRGRQADQASDRPRCRQRARCPARRAEGDTPFKYLAVHVVDKGKPLYDAPSK